ncbi:PIN domain-containing protein [Pseudonocardia sp. RS11V-5]|uniref:type II toxin-antitoxin system VapC family toxin n=1 Tax=Pseudonocardia terrae TaxID=2905831 RepID=UPI001E381D50|nr:PIN domain-containing protein [Pseudonocardia terrae]MCE3551426.1 PIN domain-containing protein [Pseudonocardia terrae]
MILDTGVLVATARGRLDLATISDSEELALPAVAVAEFLAGIEQDPDPGRRASQRPYLDGLLAIIPVVDYTVKVAEHHAALRAHVRRTSRPRGPHDLIIAATARATDRVLLTTDARARFDELPDVPVRLLGS